MTTDIAPELRTIIEASIIHAPRSQQATIGPSELGMDCPRCLTHRLAGTPQAQEAAWLPTIGTAVHAHLEDIFTRHEKARALVGLPPRFLLEQRVTVGHIGQTPITGSTDLFDTQNGVVTDWKVVGTTTLRKVKAHGAPQQYRTQAMLYGKGWQAAGYDVSGVLIYFLPRNAVSLSDAIAWTAPYDPEPALVALDRANRIHAHISSAGVDAALEAAGEHTEDGFTCRRYPDWVPAELKTPGGDPFAG